MEGILKIFGVIGIAGGIIFIFYAFSLENSIERFILLIFSFSSIIQGAIVFGFGEGLSYLREIRDNFLKEKKTVVETNKTYYENGKLYCPNCNVIVNEFDEICYNCDTVLMSKKN